MRVLIDTNVVFDVFERRQPTYSASNHILKLATLTHSSPGTGSMDQTVRAGPWQLTEFLRMRHRSTAHHDDHDVNQALFRMPSRFDEGRVVSILPKHSAPVVAPVHPELQPPRPERNPCKVWARQGV